MSSLVPVGPTGTARRWALDHLSPAEQELFHKMSRQDRRHAVAVARRARVLGSERGVEASPAFTAAALLHDVGKIEARLGTFMRVFATIGAALFGRTKVLRWEGSPGWKGRLSAYLAHDRLGAQMLETAGSDQLTISWAREHHLPTERWTVDRTTGSCLKEADGD